MKNLTTIEKSFNDKNLFLQSLTHKSWVNEHPKTRSSNERLEFLGDAVLEFVVSGILFNKFPNKEEGYLTALRANIVNTVNLAKAASKLKLGDSLYLSKGEEESGGRKNVSLLANTIEALIGAYYIDKGCEEVEKFIKAIVLDDLDELINQPLKDAKSRLQELVQAKGYLAPAYKVIKEIGPDHDKNFTVEVVVNKKSLSKGIGKSKSEAEQMAALKALTKVAKKT